MSAESNPVADAPGKIRAAAALFQKGALREAEGICRELLALQPRNFDALHLLGVIALQEANPSAAADFIAQALALNDKNATAHGNLGLALAALKRFDAALQSFGAALALKPGTAHIHNDRGNLLRAMGRTGAALESFDTAIALAPAFAAAHSNRGNALHDLHQYEAALASYDAALAIDAHIAEAHGNRAAVLRDMEQPEAALAACDRAIALKPDFAGAYNVRGHALRDLGRYAEAVASYDQALRLDPDIAFLAGVRLHTKMQICDWSNFETELATLTAQIEQGKKVSPPIPLLALTDSLAVQRKAAEVWAQEKCPAQAGLPLQGGTRERKPGRIRIGYFSMDFRQHPVATLNAGLFEAHDRARFEVSAFSFGPDTKDPMRRRLEIAFERFIDVREKSDRDIAALARDIDLDIAVDLAGYTDGSRPGIFALRAAPIQIGHLGHPGGASYIDYMIADKIVIPPDHRPFYPEKIIHLPCFQPNDRARPIADKAFTRAALGLPETGFVFCCFNNTYKITPRTFASWMRILGAVSDSVLLLYAENETAAANLKSTAAAHGVDPARLVFATRLPAMTDHFARLRTADLFLDTLPFCAHTTASDALWAGLPVLTCLGGAFSGRVAASVLKTIGLPELVTASAADFEATAVALARDPARMSDLKSKLARHRAAAALFDIKAYSKHIEDAYEQTVARHAAGLAPDHIYINAHA
jgi:predicted O-linked N-acetylglucosamine transferase (SPINDLY family)